MAYKQPDITEKRQIMKNYKKLYSFGCSFTEGGGLNNQDFRRLLDNAPDREYSNDELTEIASYESYPGYLSRILNCEYINFGVSRGCNELIFNKMYSTISNLTDTTDILVTVQPSILSRMLIQMPDQGKAESVNGLHAVTGDAKKYYELYVTRFYDSRYACNKLLQEIDVYNEWLKNKNIDVLWLPFEMDMEKCPKDSHFVDFDGYSLSEFTIRNKLLLSDLENVTINDKHFSPHGNEVIANKIHEHLKKYYD